MIFWVKGLCVKYIKLTIKQSKFKYFNILVFYILNINSKKNEYAVRVMKLSEKNTLSKIKIEIALMTLTQHENVVKYVETFYYMDCLFMVIELMNGG